MLFYTFREIIKYNECLQTKYFYQRVLVETTRTRYNKGCLVVRHSFILSVSAISVLEQRTKYQYWYANDKDVDTDNTASVGTQR